jgi:Chaperone of endosialidase
MKETTMKNRNITLTTFLALGFLTFASIALLPVAQARPPSEDRGNGNSAAENVSALNLSTTGSGNTAHGWFSLFSNTAGSSNTADGFRALYSNTTGNLNTAFGSEALVSNTDGINNSAFGWKALASNIQGLRNTAHGLEALTANTTGSENTATGASALQSNTSGYDNTAVGSGALPFNTTGTYNTALGTFAGSNVITANDVICIGALVGGENVSNSCYIGSIFGQTSTNGIPVFINSDNKLGTVTSSMRFKEDIKAMDKASKALLALKPVTFRYKKEIDPIGTSQFGLVAEDVEKVNPDLVVRDKEGRPYSVRYDQVNAMLLNEFLKEHRRVEAQQIKIEKQEAIIAQLKSAVEKHEATAGQQQKEMEVFAAGLRAQAAQIQKVTAQLELSKSAPQVVSDSR